jgi:hypothetical protein
VSRLFVRSSSEAIEHTLAAPVSGTPLAILCWFRSFAAANSQYYTQVQIQDKDASDQFNALMLRVSSGGNREVWAQTRDSVGTSQAAYTSVQWSVNEWHHSAALFGAANSRFALLDAVPSTENTTSRTPTGLDSISAGRQGDSSPTHYFDGEIAELVILSVIPTLQQVWRHAQGIPAPVVWPGWAIAAYYPLFETDRDFPRGRYNMTPVNTPAWAPHPPKVLEFWQRYQRFGAASTQTTQARIAPRVWVAWAPKAKAPAAVGQPMSLRATTVPHLRQWQPGAFR